MKGLSGSPGDSDYRQGISDSPAAGRNKGRVLTHAQIYEQVWGDFTTGNENNTIGFHICNLREKLYRANPDAPFYFRSVREVGYSLEVIAE